MVGNTQSIRSVCDGPNLRVKPLTLREILLYIVLLGLEFDIRFYGPFTLRKIVFLGLLVYIFHQGIPLKLPLKNIYALWGMASVVLFLYALFIQNIRAETVAIPGNTAFPAINIIYLCVSLFFFPVILSQIFQSMNEFFRIQLGVILLQAAVAIISRFSKPIRIAIYYQFNSEIKDMEEALESGWRVCILSFAGASASWILFIGCVICAYYILSTGKMRYLILYGILMVAMAFVGRTGLYLALLLISALLVFSLHRHADISIMVMGAGLVGFLLLAGYLLCAPESNTIIIGTLDWIDEIFTVGIGEGSTVDAIRNMPVPPLNWETLLGTGILRGTTKSGLDIQNDMGYVQTYAALGLIGAVLYYLWTFGFFAHEIRGIREKRVRTILWVFLAFMIIVEWKEPFLRKTPNAMVLITAVMLQQKDERLSERNHYDRKTSDGLRHMPKLQP